jgi:hypothetical protein
MKENGTWSCGGIDFVCIDGVLVNASTLPSADAPKVDAGIVSTVSQNVDSIPASVPMFPTGPDTSPNQYDSVEARKPLFSPSKPAQNTEEPVEVKRKWWKLGRVRAVGAVALLAVTGIFGGSSLTHDANEASNTPEKDTAPQEEATPVDSDSHLNFLASLQRALESIEATDPSGVDASADRGAIQPEQGGLIASQSIVAVKQGDTVSKVVLEDVFGAESVESGVIDPTIKNNQILHQIFLEAMTEFQQNNASITNIDQIYEGQALTVGGYSEEFLKKVEKGRAAYESLKA